MFSQQKWEDMTPEQRKRNGRVVAVALALATMLSLTFLTYALLEKTNASKASQSFEVRIQEVESQLKACQMETMATRAEADRQRMMAVAAQAEAERQREIALQAAKR